jgi:uncharacterized protein YukE
MSSKIKVETHAVTQAGVDMGDAANTTHEVLGRVTAASQPATVSNVFGEAHLNSVFNDFWTALRQQVQLSGDVFAELGKRLGGSAVRLDKGDIQNANAINKVGNSTPSAPAPTVTPSPSTPAPGAGGDTNPPPVSSAPPPPETPSPGGNSGDPGNGDGTGDGPPGTINNQGSATTTDSTTSGTGV